jgi:hypothetical protein
MSTAPANLGNEKRLQILPVIEPPMDYLGPSYNHADELRTPGGIGIKRDNTLSSVFTAIKGVAYYTDMIGFGASSNNYSKGQPLEPLGINYFMRTGQQCSNGADMYHYVEGIPKGDALGKNVKKALGEMGIPEIRGLGPGIIEDTKEATDPIPLLGALLGGAYASCKLDRRPVGDARKRITNGEDRWIDGPVHYGNNGQPYQTRWVQDKKINKMQFDCTPKKYNKDGTERKDIPPIPDECFYEEEGFTTQNNSILTAVITLTVLGTIYAVTHKLLK